MKQLAQLVHLDIYVLKKQVTKLLGSGAVQEAPTVLVAYKPNAPLEWLESENVLQQKPRDA